MRFYTRPGVIQAVVLLAALFAIGGCQSDEEKLASHMANAEAFIEEGRDEDAVIELRAALAVKPESVDAHYKLAKAYLRLQNGPGALWELRETIRLDPDNNEARRSLGGLALAAKAYDEALEHADIAISRDHTAGDAYLVRARALEGLEREEEAESAYRAAMDVRPDDSGYLMVASSFYERRKDLEAAEALILKALALDPSYETQLAYALFLRRVGNRPDETVRAFRGSIDSAKQNLKHHSYSALARYYGEVDDRENLISTLEEGIEKAGKPGPLILQLTQYYRNHGENEKADELIKSVTEGRRTSNPEPHLTLAAYRLDRGDLEGAMAAAEAALEAEPGHLRSRLRKAEILIQSGFAKSPEQVAEAATLVEAVLAEEPQNTDALFVLAKVRIAQDQLGAAAKILREIATNRPDWAHAHMVLGSTLYELGELKEARTEMARAIELDAALLDARYLMAKIHSALGEHEYAIEQGRVYLRVERSHVPTRILVAQSLASIGRLDDAQRELDAILDEERDVAANYALGRLAFVRDDMEASRKYLLLADAASPRDPNVLSALMDVDGRTGKLDDSLARIAAASQAEPENADLLRLLGEIRMFTGDTKAAEEALRSAMKLDEKNLATYQSLTQLYHARGELDKARKTLEAAAEIRPDVAEIFERLALVHEKLDNRSEAIANYRRAIEVEATRSLSKNNLAYLIVETGGSLDEALLLAKEARDMRPKDPSTADTLGWVLLKLGRVDEAITYLKEAEKSWGDQKISIGIVRHHLAQAYEASGATDKATGVLSEALSELDQQLELARKGGKELPEPDWATDVRAMATRLNTGT